MAQVYKRLSARDKILIRLSTYPVISRSQFLSGNANATAPELEAALEELMGEGLIRSKEVVLGRTLYSVYFLADAEPLVEQYHAKYLLKGAAHVRAVAS